MRLGAFCVFALIGLIPGPLAAESVPASAPDWMAGAWIETKGEGWTDEFWTPMRGGIMIGAGRSGTGEALSSWESLRIERGTDGVLTFWGSPGGAKPVPFRMVSSTATEIVFANPAHDYPQRIHYWRDGKLLNAEISLADGSKSLRWTYSAMGGN
ncbi:MAG: hypothetical protein IPI83_08420 [Sphingomonadales bacterium]|nr:hypothetical protein [Sphingomonadales bacterium]